MLLASPSLSSGTFTKRKEERHEESPHSDHQLDAAVIDDGGTPAARRRARDPFPAKPRSEREPEHEYRYHNRNDRCDDAEGGKRHPQPDDLIEKSGKARDEEDDE